MNYKDLTKDELINIILNFKKELEELKVKINGHKKLEKICRDNESLLKHALEASNDGLFNWNLKTGDVYFSPRYYTMLGYENGEFPASYDSWLNLLHDDDKESITDTIKEYIELERKSHEEQYRLRTKDNKWRWILSRGKIVEYDENNNPARMVGTHVDISDYKNVQESINYRLNFERIISKISTNFINCPLEKIDNEINNALKLIAEFAGAVRSSIFILSKKQNQITNTHEWCKDQDDSQIKLLQNIPFETFGFYKSKLEEHNNVIINKFDDIPVHAENERKWSEKHGFRPLIFVPMVIKKTLFGALGFYGKIGEEIQWSDDFISLLKFVSNIIINTIERKRYDIKNKNALKEKEVLLQELYHRTKNNMQVISSILELQHDNIEDKDIKNIFKETENKINSMALVHQMLYQSKNLTSIKLKSYVEKLSDLVLKSFKERSKNVDMYINVKDISVLIDVAIPCGLLLNELMSNSIKHAFPDGKKGHISVIIKKNAKGNIEITFSDDGVSLKNDMDLRKYESLGFQTIFNIVEHQLQGSIDYNTKKGLEYYICFNDNLYNPRV